MDWEQIEMTGAPKPRGRNRRRARTIRPGPRDNRSRRPAFKWPTLAEIITEAPPVHEYWAQAHEAKKLGTPLAMAAPRMIEATFAYAKIPNSYTLRTIRNSTYYTPGTWVSFDTMTKISNNPGWDSTMVEFHIEMPHIPLPPLPLPIP